MRNTSFFLAAALCSFGNVWAQDRIQLSQAQGRVLVNQGEQFVPAQLGQALYGDDRIMTIGASVAVVKYPDGCDFRIESDTLVTLPAVSTCAGGIAQVQRLSPGESAAIGARSSGSGFGVGGAVAIATFVVLGACAVTGECDGDGDDETISP